MEHGFCPKVDQEESMQTIHKYLSLLTSTNMDDATLKLIQSC
jgi:hypothetical protein